MLEFHLVRINIDGSLEEAFDDFSDIARKVCASMLSLYGLAGFSPPWVGYLAVDLNRFVGTCTFKSPPKDNRVEIAYYTFPRFQQMGYGIRMVRLLVDIAEQAMPGITVAAQTVPGESVSAALLKKSGFTFSGKIVHPGDGLVWEWVRQTRAGP